MNPIAAALRRPFTVAVAVVAAAALAAMAVMRMPIDVFPQLDAPVIYVAQPYGGMSPAEMEGYIVNYYESNFLFVSGVQQVESRSVQNFGLVKLSFHPGTDMSQAAAQTTSYISRALAYMPSGTVPPFVMRYDAGSLPVGDLIVSSASRSQAELDDLAQTRVRPVFASLPGVSAPPPFGGNPRSVILNLDPARLSARRLSPDDVVRALVAGNAVMPSGNARMGDLNRIVHANTVVPAYPQLLDLPVGTGASADKVLLRDVASLEDSADVVSGYAELNGRRVVYLPVTKHADASTLRVVGEVKGALGRMREQVPEDVDVSFAFDQSSYVRDALDAMLIDGILGAALTGLVVWLFLGDRRSAAIVVVVIPFALLAAVAGLWLLGQSLNLMTVGGLALAIGILVDEATVAMENIHTHLGRGEPPARAVVSAGMEILGPQVLAMLAVAAVFLPALFMQGISRSLFIPLSLAVGLAMLASLVLSLTLVPVLAVWQFRKQQHRHAAAGGMFEHLRAAAQRAAGAVARQRRLVLPIYLVLAVLLAGGVALRIGADVFPAADTGQFQLRLRAPAGTRLKRTEVAYAQALDIVNRDAGPGNVETTLGFVGTQPRSYPINLIYLWTSGPQEAVMQVALRPGSGLHLAEFEARLRRDFARELPAVSISFEAGDIIGRMMNLGSPTPIAVQVSGFDMAADHAYAEQVRTALAPLPTLRDLQYGQPYDYPAVLVDVDRQRAATLGMTVVQVGRSLTEATASSRFVARNFWQNPATGLTYQVQVLMPPAEMNNLDAIQTIPLAGGHGAKPLLLGDVATAQLGQVVGEYDHFNMQRMVSLTANVQGASLSQAAGDVNRALARLPQPPRGVHVAVVGQVQPMWETLSGLETGLVLAVIVILLLLTASFQSWRLALVVLTAVPALLTGALLLLGAFGSSLNIESFMGIITAVGISVANGILLVTVAEGARKHAYAELAGLPEPERRLRAAEEGASTGLGLRLRPILMTASAMIAGMVPMALAWESGGGQSAPLGQAVIGGLAASTVFTLLVMPAAYIALMRRRDASSPALDLEPEESHA
ncbi:MAG: efflux RND transporter permease subunit [Acidobacteria bacterium]|nr:MAG: efflux RND transporter permease subunit [Acidobacteriota bacterium]